MIAPGDITPRRDIDHEMYVAVLSNSLHLIANTGRVVVCPFIPGPIPEDAMSIIVNVAKPEGIVLPELVQWLPVAALDEAIGNVGEAVRARAGTILAGLVSQ